MQVVLEHREKAVYIGIALTASVIISYLTGTLGILVPILSVVLAAVLVFLTILFKDPLTGLFSTLVYGFCYILISRELPGIPLGYAMEALYIILWIAIICKSSQADWKRLSNDLVLLFLIWFLISVLQVVNPGASARGWLSEIRTSGFDSFMLVPAGFMLFTNQKHLNLFIIIVIACSLFAMLNGVKQLRLGLFPGEQAFLDANPTHMIWGQLRVFSFYGDAGQFGASQAAFVVLCGVLAFGPFKTWKRLAFGVLALLFFYGMLISGTRGAFFALIPGALIAIFLFKNIRILFSGIAFLLFFVAILKFTYIGSSFEYIHRLRTALDPEDASLNMRFLNQEILRDYMKSYPFGGGLGVMGYAGGEYNSGKFLASVAPDSYWVKVWGMYGITGLTFWFCMMGYIIGKSCGIVWNIRDDRLRIKLIALTASFFGIFICSYGNEVINALPSSIVSYLSLVFIFMGPELDRQISEKRKNNLDHTKTL